MEKRLENEMETAIYWDCILGLYWGVYKDNGKENGKYYNGLYNDCRASRRQ